MRFFPLPTQSLAAAAAAATATTTMMATWMLMLAGAASAQSLSSTATTTTTTNTTATASASPSSTLAISPGSGKYTYVGCYNETTGYASGGNVRALSGGILNSTTALTPSLCLSLCATSTAHHYAYAGLEYGTECWCADYLSALSAPLGNGSCDVECAGEPGVACGGRLALSLYNGTAGRGTSGAARRGAEMGLRGWGAGAVGIVVVGLGVLW